MRDFTNLQWPEAPFGAEQRPFGHHSDILTAFAIDWTGQPDDQALPVAAASVYLRIRRHGAAYDVSDETLSIGFRATVLDEAGEVPGLLILIDRALSRARRHAAILAGHALGPDLARMIALSATPMRGAVEVSQAWASRSVKGRGLAFMVDTSTDIDVNGAPLDATDSPSPPLVLDSPGGYVAVARAALVRCLAVGLMAARHTGRYHWDGAFRVADAIDRAAWDVLTVEGWTGDTAESSVPSTGT